MYRVEKIENVYEIKKDDKVIYYSNSIDAVINKLQQLHTTDAVSETVT